MPKPYIPKISIGMPVKNNEQTVAMAIESILAQTHEEWELIAVNDGSTDATLELLRKYEMLDKRVRVLSFRESKGLAKRLNLSIDESKGRYFARMDGDDISYPERFERQLEVLQASSQVSLVGTGMAVFSENGHVLGKRIYPADHASITAKPHSGFPIAHATFMGRIQMFKHIRYNGNLLRAQDQDFLRRASAAYIFANIPEILFANRERALSVTGQYRARRYKTAPYLQELLQQKKYDQALRVTLEQAAKLSIDSVAILTGLESQILRHRAEPIKPEELKDLQAVISKTAAEANASMSAIHSQSVRNSKVSVGS